ncbi:MAG: hypothetical protein A3E82_07280 [Gammaproteobacteria bacterium RIFCSPHIGHO2_12_FULL_38_11]|nr:MAG: hypothetical protein A3E82_07280 [Gammaproteobacteria bacterium RIFCSPHIGHO2_12_FULL_38_11]
MKKIILLGTCILLSSNCLAKEVTGKFGYENPNGPTKTSVSSVTFNAPGYYTCTVTNNMRDGLNSYYGLTYYKGEYPGGKSYPHVTICRQSKTSPQYTLFAGQTSQPIKFSGCISNAGARYTIGVQFTRYNQNGTMWIGKGNHDEPGFTAHCQVQPEVGK